MIDVRAEAVDECCPTGSFEYPDSVTKMMNYGCGKTTVTYRLFDSSVGCAFMFGGGQVPGG
jgi:hypothetical protein